VTVRALRIRDSKTEPRRYKVIYEIVRITVDPGQRDEFVDVYLKAWNTAAFEGSHDGKIMLAVEDPSRLDVLIEWDSVAAHRQHRRTPKQNAFRAAIDPFMKNWEVEHFEWRELVQ
jgi:quinol monooxygenase YgiN